MAQKPSTIFINPKFKNAHINPNFLPTKIHLNPKFLAQNLLNAQAPMAPIVVAPKPVFQPADTSNPIIRNTRRTLIRAPAVSSAPRSNFPLSISRSNQGSNDEKKMTNHQPQPQLIKISHTKLVTAAHLMHCQQKENEIIKNKTESIIKSKKLQRKTETKESIYKLDRRNRQDGSLQRKKSKIVSTYSIRRVTPKKVFVTDSKATIKTGQSQATNKSLVMININGVLYKSTSKKLERSQSPSSSLSPAEKLLIIRGEKFVLDSSGTKLRRDSGCSSFKLSRIDIGGLTYKASQSGGSYERDNSHQVRSHLSLAKTKSISLLARSTMQKSNAICPIYRRLGKCLSYANGRCHKLHDPRYVIVCPKFLKGSCNDEKCLLSHNVNLHKMPVCKYFLQGLCQKQRECLYLHKKLTDDTKLCAEFLKGYCPLADKCNLLHDFPQTDQREKKKFSIVRNKPKRSAKKSVEHAPAAVESVRYYIDDESASSSNGNVPKRGALGSLPSYIPL